MQITCKDRSTKKEKVIELADNACLLDLKLAYEHLSKSLI